MTAPTLLAFGATAFLFSISLSLAGPCSEDIVKMQSRIDAKVGAIAAAGSTARQGVGAGMSVQPTPRSIAAAEEKLGELPPGTVVTVREAMLRARATDNAGDKSGCEQALADAQRAIGP